MTDPVSITFHPTDLDAVADAEGIVAVLVEPGGKLDPAGRRVNKLPRGALERLVQGAAFSAKKPGEAMTLACPVGMLCPGGNDEVPPAQD